MRAFSTGWRGIGSVVRDVYYSATVSYCGVYYPQTPLYSRAGHTPSTVECYVYHEAVRYLLCSARKKCGESRRSNTLTMTVLFFELKTMYSVCRYSSCTCICLCTYIHVLYITLRRVFFFLLLVALLDTCTNMISRFEIRNCD